MNNALTVGLFGTCGGSRWRQPFMDAYQTRNIPYFNPQVENWIPECADVEAKHLVEDGIILFPVTDETTGLGSLAETGFSMFQAMKTNINRYFVFMISPKPDPLAVQDPVLFKESTRARALVRAHLAHNHHQNVFVCERLDQMLDISLYLHQSLCAIDHARRVLEK